MRRSGAFVRTGALLLWAFQALPPCHAADTLQACVLLDDLIPPSSPITVQLLCDEKLIAETTADEEGRFSVPVPNRDHTTCRLQAAAAGYESDSVSFDRLPLRADIGALVLKRSGRWNGYALSVTNLTARREARRLFEEAVRAMRQGGQNGMARAEQAFERAAEADPSVAEAWHQLGRLRLARQDIDGGRSALRQAIEADPWYVSPYRPLLLLELGEGHWSAVLEMSGSLLRLSPYLADIRYYRGLAALGADEVDLAAEEAQAIAEGPEGATFALLHHLRGLVFERGGQMAEARAAYERFLDADPEGPAADEVRVRLKALEAQ
jgi:tetratricopeptide (TPR) repeat protein